MLIMLIYVESTGATAFGGAPSPQRPSRSSHVDPLSKALRIDPQGFTGSEKAEQVRGETVPCNAKSDYPDDLFSELRDSRHEVLLT